MSNLIQLKRSTTATNVPTLAAGEAGVNLADRVLYLGNTSGAPIPINKVAQGANTQVLFNDSGYANGSAGVVFDKTANVLTVSNGVVAIVSTSVGNSTVNTAANSTTLTTANVVLSTGLSVGSNVALGTATVFVGNSTVNAVINSTTISVGAVVSGGSQGDYVTFTTTGTSGQIVDSWLVASWRGVKYVASVKDNAANGYQMSEMMVVFDDTNPLITEYAQLVTNSALGTFSANANTTAVRLVYTPVSANTTIKMARELLAV